MKILLVEDDADLIDVTAYSLRREHFAVIQAADGRHALQRCKTDRPDLIVLDLGLPKQDGFEVLQRIREREATPVVVVSGRNNEHDITRAFTLGADDYVIKPVAAKQLALRIRAILRRTSIELDLSGPTVSLGDLELDPESQDVIWGGRLIRLTPTEFRIFHLLAIHVGRTVATNRLLTYVWGYDGGDSNALRTHISHIRAKLDLVSRPAAAISGVPGVGYRFTVNGPLPGSISGARKGVAERLSELATS